MPSAPSTPDCGYTARACTERHYGHPGISQQRGLQDQAGIQFTTFMNLKIYNTRRKEFRKENDENIIPAWSCQKQQSTKTAGQKDPRAVPLYGVLQQLTAFMLRRRKG